MKLYPLFADLAGRRVLVVGGGAVAERKAAALLEAGAAVTVGALSATGTLQAWADAGRLELRLGGFQQAWLDECWLVVAATGEPLLNRRIATLAERRRLFVNVVDDAQLCSFHVPAVIDRDPVTIAISSGGTAPVLARLLREGLESLLDPALGPLAALAARLRESIRARLPDLGARRRFYEQLFAGPVLQLLRRAQPAEAEAEAERALAGAATRSSGSVVLVGAGPGDPGLLTLRGLRALQEADVILYDRLAGAEVLALARRDAERIEVGKEAGNHHVTQERIHALLLEHAQAGRRVVRLKGGDPFVFGRGGEELAFLRGHGVDCAIVPGITAAVACAAYAGIPLTHREHAQSVCLVTAHGKDAAETLSDAMLAQPRQTLAVYMGVERLGMLTARLLARGRAPDTPVALIEHGTTPRQRVIAGVLRELPMLAKTHAVATPALLIVGEVAAFAHTQAWFGELVAEARAIQPQPVRMEVA